MGFNIGPIPIRYYGIIIMVGVFAAAWLIARQARRAGENAEIVWDGLFWVVLGGVIGARIWHILTPPPSMVEQGITTYYYLTHPLAAINIRAGGLGVPGAVIGGAIVMLWYSRRVGINYLQWGDFIMPGLALGQAIGRWGNFVNQELYGAPTDLPWAIEISPQFRLPEYANQATYHPLFLYESLWNLANMFLLLWLPRRFPDRLKHGDVFLTYLVVYPVGRFLLEFLRLDAAQIAGINANQTFMAVVALVAASLLLFRHRPGLQEERKKRKRRRTRAN